MLEVIYRQYQEMRISRDVQIGVSHFGTKQKYGRSDLKGQDI